MEADGYRFPLAKKRICPSYALATDIPPNLQSPVGERLGPSFDGARCPSFGRIKVTVQFKVAVSQQFTLLTVRPIGEIGVITGKREITDSVKQSRMIFK